MRYDSFQLENKVLRNVDDFGCIFENSLINQNESQAKDQASEKGSATTNVWHFMLIVVNLPDSFATTAPILFNIWQQVTYIFNSAERAISSKQI